MTVKVRLSGDPAEIEQLITFLSGRFDVAGGERHYPNRGSFGVRAYLEVRHPADGVRPERIHPQRKEIEP
ncbi:hypothetical protein HPO96_29290 [Kribbella sandramycini]|uniref:Uncharacterized protein n=1 Tax=Kribbella sandramycini TaxID=60450 RepID=A0A7Y4L4S9_9ACTN|nr:hypothetical protein [Kribbella sandramycini]MBB6571705.1 hypothetical protein [Kribbella sandramycini]NOL44350.1 hypothetical protein [Kribbella sandramycini]